MEMLEKDCNWNSEIYIDKIMFQVDEELKGRLAAVTRGFEVHPYLVCNQLDDPCYSYLAVQDSSITDIVCPLVGPLEPTNNQSLGSIKEWP